jgi:hypothetical protein
MALALGWNVALLTELDRVSDARNMVDELLEIPNVGDQIGPDLAVALHVIGANSNLDRLVAATTPGSWRDFYGLVAKGALLDAADAMAELGLMPGEALMRQHAARTMLAAGEAARARPQLDRAVSFWRTVGATRFLNQADAMYSEIAAAGGQGAGATVVH